MEEGYSYEGVDVFIAYSGVGDEEAERERVGQAMIEENKRQAEKEAAARKQVGGASASTGGAHSGVSGSRGAGSRDGTGLIPPAVRALRRMTGRPFESTAEVVRWLRSSRRLIQARCRELESLERRQKGGESVR